MNTGYNQKRECFKMYRVINDKSGCNGVRSIEYANNIIKTKNLQKESSARFSAAF